jgi:hypothetical protein
VVDRVLGKFELDLCVKIFSFRGSHLVFFPARLSVDRTIRAQLYLK